MPERTGHGAKTGHARDATGPWVNCRCARCGKETGNPLWAGHYERTARKPLCEECAPVWRGAGDKDAVLSLFDSFNHAKGTPLRVRK